MNSGRGRIIGLALIGFLFTSASAARAAFVFDSTSRSIYGHTHGSTDPEQSLSTSATGFYENTTSVTSGGGSASQHLKSDLQPTLMSFLGDFSGVYPAFAFTGYTEGRASATIHFHVTENTDVLLTADGSSSSQVPVDRTLTLTGPGMNVNWTLVYNPPPPPPIPVPPGPFHFAQQGTLTPGSYTLSYSLQSKYGAAGAPAASYSAGIGFDIKLSIPEPATGCTTVLLPAMFAMIRRKRSV